VGVAPRTFRNRAEVQAWNDEMVGKYDLDRFHNHPSVLVRWIEGERVRRIWALLAPGASDRVLEVGCGAGHLLARVPAGRRFGVDLAHVLLQRARGRLGADAALAQGDAIELPFPSNTFERVYCSEVLEHLPDPAAALDEIRRILKSGGVAVLSVPNESLINTSKTLLRRTGLLRLLLRAGRSGYEMPDRMDDEWHLHTFDRASFVALVRPRLLVTHVHGVPFRWLPLRYVVRCEAV
jgi:ubiquinone/menaquinone biosynthesis C-methylase UbiE